MLPDEVINKLNLIQVESQLDFNDDLKVTGSQGNFFTAINNERYDEKVTIANNYFDMDKTRNINSDFGTDVLVSGINVAVDGQRRDHIIYSKGYKNLNIYGNYFKGMENGAAGGLKIRNGENAYIGSNHFYDVPVLTYIYGDLTQDVYFIIQLYIITYSTKLQTLEDKVQEYYITKALEMEMT